MNISSRPHPTNAGLWPTLLIAAVLAFGAASNTPAGEGNQGNKGVFPPQSHPYGRSYSEWAAAWWSWAYSIPANQNPITDTTGEFSNIGQSGPVFFLAGSYGGVTVRHCTVPAGKGLLFPLLNQSWVQFPGDPPFTVPELRAIIAPYVAEAKRFCKRQAQLNCDPG
jgi:hypothetical protein